MKKIYIIIAAFATLALVSCEQEKSFNDEKIGENGIVLSLEGAASTRSADVATVQKGVKLELDDDENGQILYLEETIEDLNAAWVPATKGTPAYTQNVGKLYKDLGVVIKNGSSVLSTSNFWAMDNEIVGGGWRYQGEFGAWPDDSTPLDFYLWMPADTAGLGYKDFTTGKTNSSMTFSFTYTSPKSAAAQKDLIFAARAISKSDAKSGTNKSNGVPVLFNHALTGVKFAIENYDTSKKIAIKSVSFTGLVGTASCVVTPASESEYKDNKTNYSSANETVVKWTIPATPDRSKTYSSGEFTDTVYFAPKGSFENVGEYPESFSQAGNKHNLNDTDATQTFWFIPQPMTNDVILTIEYTYGNDTKKEGKIEFGKALSGVTWKAGQLRTYTIRVDDVNVMIKDTVSIVEPFMETLTDPAGRPFDATSYKGSYKDNVTITNTGNTDAYIRAALIGQWLDEDGNPVFGFTDYATGDVALVASWYQDQFVNGTFIQGKFTGLPGYNGTASTYHNWTKGEDGFYYYNNIVKEGQSIPAADSLFTRYTVGTPPAVKVAGGVKDVYFELEVATQAISAKKQNGDDWPTYSAAWANAKAAQ